MYIKQQTADMHDTCMSMQQREKNIIFAIHACLKNPSGKVPSIFISTWPSSQMISACNLFLLAASVQLTACMATHQHCYWLSGNEWGEELLWGF